MKAALIGKGRWGMILTPYIKNCFDLVSVSGRRDTDIAELAKKVDAFFIATPAQIHYPIVRECLKHGRNVFCEKPLTTDYNEALELQALALKKGVVLYTDYVEMTAPSRLKMIDLLPALGKIVRIEAVTIQKCDSTSHMFWQLSSHQLSILSLFVNLKSLKFKESILSEHVGCIYGNNNDIKVYLHVNTARSHRKKVFTIWGSNGWLYYDCHNDNTIESCIDGFTNYFRFDEKNNLKYSVQKFADIINDSASSNTDTAIEITKIIEDLLS